MDLWDSIKVQNMICLDKYSNLALEMVNLCILRMEHHLIASSIKNDGSFLAIKALILALIIKVC